jgi:hypothetical protein
MRPETVYKKNSFAAANLTIKPHKELFKDLSRHPGLLISSPLEWEGANIDTFETAWSLSIMNKLRIKFMRPGSITAESRRNSRFLKLPTR